MLANSTNKPNCNSGIKEWQKCREYVPEFPGDDLHIKCPVMEKLLWDLLSAESLLDYIF